MSVGRVSDTEPEAADRFDAALVRAEGIRAVFVMQQRACEERHDLEAAKDLDRVIYGVDVALLVWRSPEFTDAYEHDLAAAMAERVPDGERQAELFA